jgi:hypothetical protein
LCTIFFQTAAAILSATGIVHWVCSWSAVKIKPKAFLSACLNYRRAFLFRWNCHLIADPDSATQHNFSEWEETALHWAAKDWAVRHWAAKDQLVLLLIHRAAAAGNLHWVCAWFATAESDQYKMKPQEFLDLDMFRHILQGQEGHQVDAANHRCFCGWHQRTSRWTMCGVSPDTTSAVEDNISFLGILIPGSAPGLILKVCSISKYKDPSNILIVWNNACDQVWDLGFKRAGDRACASGTEVGGSKFIWKSIGFYTKAGCSLRSSGRCLPTIRFGWAEHRSLDRLAIVVDDAERGEELTDDEKKWNRSSDPRKVCIHQSHYTNQL